MTDNNDIISLFRDINAKYSEKSLEEQKEFWRKLLDMTQEQNQKFVEGLGKDA